MTPIPCPLRRSHVRVCLRIAVWLATVYTGLHANTGMAQERRGKVIQLEEIRIEGRVQKPNAFYILNRSQLGYEVKDLRASLIGNVVRAVERGPF